MLLVVVSTGAWAVASAAAGPCNNELLPVHPPIPPMGWRLTTVPTDTDGIELNGSIPHVCGQSASGGNWVQLLILDNKTLDVKLARAFNKGQSSDLKRAIEVATDHALVVLTGGGIRHAQKLSSSERSVLDFAWKRLGGSKHEPAWDNGKWSIVGRPFSPSGSAMEVDSLSAGPVLNGGMSGLLEKNSHNIYTFVYDAYVPFHATAGPYAGVATVSIGGEHPETFRSRDVNNLEVPPPSGFYVLVLGPGKLPKIDEGTFVTDNEGRHPEDQGIEAMASFLKKYTSNGFRALIFIESIGHPRPLDSAWTDKLTPAVAKIGGTPDVFNNLDGSGGYVLIGGTTLATGWGDELSQPMTGKAPELQGLLSRNSMGALEPNFADSNGKVSLDLIKLAYKPTKPFPAWPKEGQKKAYERISAILPLPGDDLRTDYWYAHPEWNDIRTTMDRIPLDQINSQGVSGVTQQDLDAVRSQLDTEISYVIQIHNWINGVKSIYTKANASNGIQIHDIVGSITPDVRPRGDSTATAQSVFEGLSAAFSIASDVFDIAGPAGPALGAVSGALALASLRTADSNGNPDNTDFTVRVSKLADELQAHYLETTSELDRLGDILVSDPEKLKIAGVASTKLWSFSTDKSNAVVDALNRVARQTIWQALMPVRFRNDILHKTDLNTDPRQARHYTCEYDRPHAGPVPQIIDRTLYEDEPDLGQEYILDRFDRRGKPGYQLHAFGDAGVQPADNSSWNKNPSLPSDAALKHLFSTNDQDQNAAGFYRLEFFNRYVPKRDVSCKPYSG